MAYSDYSQSPASAEAQVTTTAWPEAPTDLTATPGSSDNRIDLAWSPVNGAVGYDIEEQSGQDGGWTVVNSCYNYEDTPVEYPAYVTAGGNSYSFRIAAVDANGGVAGKVSGRRHAPPVATGTAVYIPHMGRLDSELALCSK